MKKIKIWLKAFRLRTLPLSLSGIIAGSAYAYYTGNGSYMIFIFAIFTTLFLQILSNLANDLGDTLKGADNENRVGPKRSVQSGDISIVNMKKAVVVFSLLSIISALILIYIGIIGQPIFMILTYIILAIFSVIAAITYTVGKKAYGYSGLGDIFVFIFFGGVSTLGVYTLYAKTFSFELILIAMSIGFLSTAVLNLNNLRDHENDKIVGKNTLIVKFGFQKGKIYHATLLTTAILSYLTFTFLIQNFILLIGIIAFIPLLKHLNKVIKCKEPRALDSELKKVAISTFLLSILFAIGLWI